MLEEIEKYAKEEKVPIMMKDGIEYLCNYIKQDVIDIILFYVNLLKRYKIKGDLINSDEFINENKNAFCHLNCNLRLIQCSQGKWG